MCNIIKLLYNDLIGHVIHSLIMTRDVVVLNVVQCEVIQITSISSGASIVFPRICFKIQMWAFVNRLPITHTTHAIVFYISEIVILVLQTWNVVQLAS